VNVPLEPTAVVESIIGLLTVTGEGWRNESALESQKGAANQGMMGTLRWGADRLDALASSIRRLPLTTDVLVPESVALLAFAQGYEAFGPEGFDFEDALLGGVEEDDAYDLDPDYPDAVTGVQGPQVDGLRAATFVVDESLGSAQEPQGSVSSAPREGLATPPPPNSVEMDTPRASKRGRPSKTTPA